MKLIICGNGFDLHHGFKTGYHHYKNFLEVHYPQAIRDFEDFPYINLSVSNKWSDLESSLSLDYDDCLIENSTSNIVEKHEYTFANIIVYYCILEDSIRAIVTITLEVESDCRDGEEAVTVSIVPFTQIDYINDILDILKDIQMNISDESKSQQKLLKKLLAKELPEGGYYIDTESPYITANTTIVEASITLAQIYYLSN